MKTVLSCCVGGGLVFGASIPTDKANGQHFGLSVKDNGILVRESHEVKKEKTVNESKWNESKQIFEYFDEVIEYFESVQGFEHLFPTIEQAVQFLNEKQGLKIIFEPYSKELTDDWTIEQKLAYDGNNRQECEDIAKGKKIKVVEYELAKYVSENPNKSTKELQNMFEGGVSKDFQYSLMSRLCHDYGKDTSPILIQESGAVVKDPENNYRPIIKNEGWVISPQGLEFIKVCEEQEKKDGYISGSFY